MAGTRAGGAKASQTNKEKYGADFYKNIGAKGGKAKVPKGFATLSRERLREICIKGGTKSRRTK